ncbi:MAG: tetratricopeptide repeat protein [Acidimicrobiales bacterium]
MSSGDEFEVASRGARDGDAGAMHTLGNLLREQGDLDGAEAWYRRAADRGNASSMSNLGLVLKERGDRGGAETWFRRAAERQNAYAMSNLALLLAEGGDLDGAEVWYRRAAAMGNTGAMHNLGSMLLGTGDRDGAEAWFRRSVEGANTAAMVALGLLRQDQGDLDGAEAWYRRAAARGMPEGSDHLEALHTKRAADADLEAVAFDTFGWELSRNRLRYRQWRGEGASLTVRFIAGPSDFRSWNAEEIREDLLERLAFVASPRARLDDLPLPDWFESHRPAELPEQISLLEVSCFAVGGARCVLASYRHRMRGGVYFSTGIFILFGDCFWLVRLELGEGPAVGARAGAVARRVLGDHGSASSRIERFDPYERRWDGLIALEDDPLTRMRLLASRLQDSIVLDDRLGGLTPFAPTGG